MQRQRRFDATGFPESLETRLRNLPPLPVPGDLEAQLVAAIPKKMRQVSHRGGDPRQRDVFSVAACVAVAAVCLLMMVLTWPKFAEQNAAHRLVVTPDKSESADQPDQKGQRETLKIVTRLENRRSPMAVEMQPFTWPIHEASPLMVSSAIPRDLLD